MLLYVIAELRLCFMVPGCSLIWKIYHNNIMAKNVNKKELLLQKWTSRTILYPILIPNTSYGKKIYFIGVAVFPGGPKNLFKKFNDIQRLFQVRYVRTCLWLKKNIFFLLGVPKLLWECVNQIFGEIILLGYPRSKVEKVKKFQKLFA